jgi:hypothetical protein
LNHNIGLTIVKKESSEVAVRRSMKEERKGPASIQIQVSRAEFEGQGMCLPSARRRRVDEW